MYLPPPNAVLILDRRRRRRANIKTTSGQLADTSFQS